MQNWNPNTPHSIGLELLNQGASFRRIAGLQQQLITFKALATEAITSALVPVGPGTVATTQAPPRKSRFSEAVPDYGTLPMNSVEGVVCADIGYPSQTIYTNEYAVSGIGAVMNGTTDHRYSRNDDIGERFDGSGDPLPSVSTVGTGLASDVQTEGDGNYLSDPGGNKHIGASSFTFNSNSFPSGRHVLAVEFIVRSNGPTMVTFANNITVPGTWRTSPARMFFDSKEFENNVYRVGEAFMENRDGATNEVWRLSPLEFVRGFSSEAGLRRLVVATDATPLASALVRTRIDYIVMRVYSTDETRQATGWVTKAGRVTFRVPTDLRRASDALTTPSPYSKTINQTQNILLRQFFPGNIPMPSMVLSTPRIYGSASFSADWSVRDTVGSPQSYGPTVPAKDAEPAIPALTMFTVLGNDASVTSESQPYSATGGVFPYSGSVNTEKPTTKNLPTGYTGALAYVLISDSLAPTNSLTVTLGSTPDTGGTTTSVTLTPTEVAASPIVGQSIVSGSGTYGTNLPWRLDPTVVRWRRVRVQFPASITFGGTGGRISFKALPNAITQAGFTENYLIGAVFPQTAGGIYPTRTISGDVSVPAVSTDGVTTYAPVLANADLQVVLASVAPLPVAASPTLVTDSASPVANHPRFSWTWGAAGGLGARRFEVDRWDDITAEWQRIFEVATASTLNDYEARYNVPVTYRVRVVRTDGIESAWVTFTSVTPVLADCTLAFSSNSDPTINSMYVDTYSGDTSQAYSYRDAGSVEFRQVYGREYDIAFRKKATGGVEFTRNVLLPTGDTPRPQQNVDKSLLALTRHPTLPYVCVRDSYSNRWFASVTQSGLLTTRAIGCNRPIAVASLNIVEIAQDPYVSPGV